MIHNHAKIKVIGLGTDRITFPANYMASSMASRLLQNLSAGGRIG